MASTHNRTANNSAFIALICLIPIFLFVITTGWSNILASTAESLTAIKPLSTFLKFLFAFFIAVVGMFLGKVIAAEQLRVKNEEKINPNEPVENRYTWIAYFALLFAVSSLGTMTFLFQTAAGATVFSSALTKTETSLNTLKDKLPSFLAPPEFSEKSRKVEVLRKQFLDEFSNPVNCGFGTETVRRFNDLNQELGKRLIRYSGTVNCKDTAMLEQAKKSYHDQIDSVLLNSMDEKTKSILTKKDEFITKLDTQIKKIEPLIDAPNSLTKDKVVPVLQESWGVYSSILKSAESLTNQKTGLPDDISDEKIIQSGEITNTIPMLLSRWKNIQTYFIIVAAILFDVLLIVFFRRHLSSSNKKIGWAF